MPIVWVSLLWCNLCSAKVYEIMQCHMIMKISYLVLWKGHPIKSKTINIQLNDIQMYWFMYVIFYFDYPDHYIPFCASADQVRPPIKPEASYSDKQSRIEKAYPGRIWIRNMSPWIQPELKKLCFILVLMVESLHGKIPFILALPTGRQVYSAQICKGKADQRPWY